MALNHSTIALRVLALQTLAIGVLYTVTPGNLQPKCYSSLFCPRFGRLPFGDVLGQFVAPPLRLIHVLLNLSLTTLGLWACMVCMLVCMCFDDSFGVTVLGCNFTREAYPFSVEFDFAFYKR